jgi:hypothetical protein
MSLAILGLSGQGPGRDQRARHAWAKRSTRAFGNQSGESFGLWPVLNDHERASNTPLLPIQTSSGWPLWAAQDTIEALGTVSAPGSVCLAIG